MYLHPDITFVANNSWKQRSSKSCWFSVRSRLDSSQNDEFDQHCNQWIIHRDSQWLIQEDRSSAERKDYRSTMRSPQSSFAVDARFQSSPYLICRAFFLHQLATRTLQSLQSIYQELKYCSSITDLWKKRLDKSYETTIITYNNFLFSSPTVRFVFRSTNERWVFQHDRGPMLIHSSQSQRKRC